MSQLTATALLLLDAEMPGGYKPGSVIFDYLLAGYYEDDNLIFIAKIKNGFTPALRRKGAEHFKGFNTTRRPLCESPRTTERATRRGDNSRGYEEDSVAETRISMRDVS